MKNKKIITAIILIIIAFILGGLVSIACVNIFYKKERASKEILLYKHDLQTEIQTEMSSEEIISTESETKSEMQTSFYIQPDYDSRIKEPTQYYHDTFYQEDKNQEAMKLYMEFIRGEKTVGKNYTIDDNLIPTGEPDRRYDTRYAFWDCNGDGLKELHIESAKKYDIISYKDGKLYFWKKQWENQSECASPLNNGGFLEVNYLGFIESYTYTMFDVNGNKTFSVSFGENTCIGYQEYWYDGINVTKELYDALTKKYFEIGDDKIEWTYLYHDYYDGKNHYDKYNHNDE